MRALEYAFRQGWTSLWRARGSALVAVAAIALIVLGALLLVTWNAQRLIEQLASAAEFSVFLQEDVTAEQRRTLEETIERSGVASGITYVSKDQALATFRRRFVDLSPAAAALGENPFPASLEVRLGASASGEDIVESLVMSIARMPGVEDVRYDGEWLGRVQVSLRALNMVAFALATLIALAAAVTVAAVVRLGLLARAEEIEIMELVGAPLAFIRGPFVAEGLLQGGLGALTAMVVLVAGYFGLQAWWTATFGTALGGVPVEFLPFQMCLYLLLGGMVVGSAGGLIASRHAGDTSAAAR